MTASRVSAPAVHEPTAHPTHPTLADVAARAGVSGQTVSRVVNGAALVTPQTASRVRRVIAEMGYRPNSTARALKARRSNTIGIVTADSTLYGRTELLFATERAVRAAGYYVSVFSVSEVTRTDVIGAVERLHGQGVEGLVVLCGPGGPDADLGIAVDVPTVLTWQAPGSGMSWAAFDQVRGARTVVRHLLSLGHESVAHVAGPADHPAAAPRRSGWASALRRAGLPVPEPLTGDWTAASGYAAGQQLARDPSVTAVFCGNDQMALGVLRAVTEAGRRVPEQVSVAGFDDTADSAYYSPPLTTVRQDFRRLGESSVGLLRRQLTDPATDRRSSMLSTRVVVRASTGARRADAGDPVTVRL